MVARAPTDPHRARPHPGNEAEETTPVKELVMEPMPDASIRSGVEAKADFDRIYDRPDPRAYFNGLGEYDYEVPQHGKAVFQQVLDALPTERPRVVDLCCSYGVNAALLKHDLDLEELYDHYTSDEVARLSSEELAEFDRVFFQDRRLPDAPEVVGLDVAAPAVDYALGVGLLDRGASENLEDRDPSPDLAAAVADADLVTVTGGIGYVTQRTFDRLMACTSEAHRPWIASLCLRTVPFDPIADCLTTHGLVTEQLEDVAFPQRRFANEEEREAALYALARRGISPEGREAEGSFYVDVYLSRPKDEATERPVDDIIVDLP
jgi:hypothetical protein